MITEPQFVKHSVSKAFPAAVYTSLSLADATEKLLPESLVHVGEPACDPAMVLETLLRACVPTASIEAEWDFRTHYFNACP